MSLSTSIPKFLLPQRGAIWRTRLPITAASAFSLTIRHASNKKHTRSSGPIVLEQPTKFNPPSHGSRLRKPGPQYPGPNLLQEDEERMKYKKYPNMMPSEGTFMHWFLTNRSIHLWICLTTLFTLATTVLITDFKHNSPFANMLPAWYDLFFHPIAFTRTVVEVTRLNSAHQTAKTQERRNRKMEDVAKRSAFRKAHGLDKDEGFGGWTAKTEGQSLVPAVGEEGDQQGEVEVRQRRPPVKKWFGIW
ncbi:hypothetical protein BJ878DRAFT_412386 [Calycina marina]|uniref:Uncharacterized protein n=1 Tax=Calycina marina TaxID=1763456 RepID=A0A9P8CJ68_9HELO|nr:hypothetical protein BJ878DRAFT_412386 [Calycina marina]